jgi:hypothetical protein
MNLGPEQPPKQSSNLANSDRCWDNIAGVNSQELAPAGISPSPQAYRLGAGGAVHHHNVQAKLAGSNRSCEPGRAGTDDQDIGLPPTAEASPTHKQQLCAESRTHRSDHTECPRLGAVPRDYFFEYLEDGPG